MLFARTWPRPRHCARSIPHWASLAGPGSPPPGGWGAFRPRARAPCRAGVEAGRCPPGRASIRGSWGAGEPAPVAARTPAPPPPRVPPGGQRHIQPVTQVDWSPRPVPRPTPPGGPGSPTFHRWSRASCWNADSPRPQFRKLRSATCGGGGGGRGVVESRPVALVTPPQRPPLSASPTSFLSSPRPLTWSKFTDSLQKSMPLTAGALRGPCPSPGLVRSQPAALRGFCKKPLEQHVSGRGNFRDRFSGGMAWQ